MSNERVPCFDTGQIVVLATEGVPGKPYLVVMTCPACHESWTETR